MPNHKILLYSLLLLIPAFSSARPHKNKNRKPAAAPVINQPSESLSLQRILQAQDQRLSKDPYLLSALRHSSSTVVQAAILALGRIGDPYAVEALSTFINRKDPTFKKAAAFSLSLIGGELSYKLLSQAAPMEKNPEIRGALFVAMGRSGNEATVQLIARHLRKETSETVVADAAEAIGLLWSGDSAKWDLPEDLIPRLVQLSKSKTDSSIAAAFALSRYKGEAKYLPVDAILEAINRSPYPFVQGLLCRVLAKIQTPTLTTTLSALLAGSGNPALRIEAAKALRGRTPSGPLYAALKQSLTDKNPQVLVTTLETIGSYGLTAKELSEAVDVVFKNSKSAWVKSTALKVLCRLSPEAGRQRVADIFHVPTSPLYPAAITSLVILGTEADLKLYINQLSHPDSKMVGESLDALLSYTPEKFSESLRAGLKNLLNTKDMGMTSQVAELANQNKWKDFAAPLATAYSQFQQPDQIEVKISILNALGALGSATQVPLLEQTIATESEKLVITAAVNSLKTLTGKDESARIPLNSKVTQSLPPYSELQKAANSHVVLKTTQGDIELKMLSEAPVTAYHFIHFVQTHFYDDKEFHRVVPNFVTQGGDPRGDGFGGPGFLIRDEVSRKSHDRGVLGIATAGRDTGGCQFFFNLAPNLHLNGKYTAFAEVTRGLEVVDRLEIGDKILSARVR